MGTSTNGQLCYGIVFEEGFEFPWGDDIEDWWTYTIHGFKHSFELFDSAGNYLNGREPSRDECSRYWQERRDFEALHPLPVEVVNYCSGECPMYLLAVPGTVRVACRGYPEVIHPSALVVSNEGRDGLIGFLNDHGIDIPSDPGWLLTSYWG